MAYFNYHAKAKRLIAEGKLTDIKVFANWNQISPALVLFFDSEKPMPIRRQRWEEYFELIKGSLFLPPIGGGADSAEKPNTDDRTDTDFR